jgi:hypothetical protein
MWLWVALQGHSMLDVGCSMLDVLRWLCPPEQSSAWQPKLLHWADLITSGRADALKESELLPDFLTDIFGGLLGYTAGGSFRGSRRRQSAPYSRGTERAD